jgi:hypothetical protein
LICAQTYTSTANLLPSAKTGYKWAQKDLRAYRIEVVPETVTSFFGNANLPASTASPEILLSNYVAGSLKDAQLPVFFNYLEDAMMIPGEKSSVVDFTHHLLELLDYDKPKGFIFRRKHLPLLMCSTNTRARVDVCIIDLLAQIQGVRLLAQVDTRKSPEPQLIAGAIAAFQSNNCELSGSGLPTVNTAVIPGITMVRTAPTFYKINLTKTVVDAIERGEYPAQTTVVHKLTPRLTNLQNYDEMG